MSRQKEDSFRLPIIITQRYSPSELIEHQKYWKIYKAIDRTNNTPVFIKQYYSLLKSIEGAKSALREFVTLKINNKSQSIIKLLDHYYDYKNDLFPHQDEQLFLILEYFPFNLREYLRVNLENITKKKVSLKKIISLIVQCVNYLHEINIIHMDIRPENIFIDERLQVKLGNFGNSRCISYQSNYVSQNVTQMIYQTYKSLIQEKQLKESNYSMVEEKFEPEQPSQIYELSQYKEYQAPELLLMQKFDKSCDVWSMGCVFAEIVQTLQTNSVQQPIFKVQNNDHQLIKILTFINNVDQTLDYDFQGKQFLDFCQFLIKPSLHTFKNDDFQELFESTLNFSGKLRKQTDELLKLKLFEEVNKNRIKDSPEFKCQIIVDKPNFKVDLLDLKFLLLNENISKIPEQQKQKVRYANHQIFFQSLLEQ